MAEENISTQQQAFDAQRLDEFTSLQDAPSLRAPNLSQMPARGDYPTLSINVGQPDGPSLYNITVSPYASIPDYWSFVPPGELSLSLNFTAVEMAVLRESHIFGDAIPRVLWDASHPDITLGQPYISTDANFRPALGEDLIPTLVSNPIPLTPLVPTTPITSYGLPTLTLTKSVTVDGDGDSDGTSTLTGMADVAHYKIQLTNWEVRLRVL